MASPEGGNRTTQEKIGRGALYTGIVIGAIGLIRLSAEAVLLGGGIAAAGIIFERTGKKKQ
jgi:hypothetical protein